jgi:kynurenine formamidase
VIRVIVIWGPGPVLLVDAPRDTNLTAQVLASLHIPPGVERIIFRTLNTDRRLMWKTAFDSSYVGLTTDGAEWIVTQTKIRFIGIDYLSIAAYINLVPAHQVLLKKKLILVEGLNLDDVDMGLYIMHCLPLKLMQAEGCPIRCILTT